MVDCSAPESVNGSLFRIYVDTNPGGSVAWTQIGGETSSGIDVSPVTADGSTKDSTGGMNLPTGYDWSMDCDAAWDSDDAGQEEVRTAALARETRKIAWRPSGDTTGYYGYASFGWNGKGPQRDVATFTFSVKGCGDVTDAS